MQIQDQLKEIKSKIERVKTDVISAQAKEDLFREQCQKCAHLLEDMDKRYLFISKCIEVTDLVQKSVNSLVKIEFEKIVNSALHSVFGEGFSFELEFGRRGDIPELEFQIKEPKFSGAFDPLDTSAGGVIDITAMILRVTLVEMFKPRAEGPLLLDEPFKHLSKKYLPSASLFLEKLKSKINRQIIMVSHSDELISESGTR